MASNSIYHKYTERDMSDIRCVRACTLMVYKMQERAKRLDKITEAILPDIKWERIAPNISRDDLEWELTEAIELNAAVAAFREEMAQKLELVIQKKADYALETLQGAYEPNILEAGTSMAQKYFARSKKSGKQHKSKPKPKHHNTKSTETQSTPPRVRQTTGNTASPSTPKARPVTTPTTRQTPPTSSNTAQTSSFSPSESITRIHRTQGTTASDTTHRGQLSTTGNNDPPALTPHQSPKATTIRATIQPTIKKSFKVKKGKTKPKRKV